MIGLAEDVAKGAPGSRTAEEEAASVRNDTPVAPPAGCVPRSGASATCSPISTTAPGTVPSRPRSDSRRRRAHVLVDTYVHADDVRDASAPPRRGAGLGARVAYLAGELTTGGWGPATLTLDDVAARAVGTGGPTVTGDPLEFVLVATGRRDPGALGLDAEREHLRRVATVGTPRGTFLRPAPVGIVGRER